MHTQKTNNFISLDNKTNKSMQMQIQTQSKNKEQELTQEELEYKFQHLNLTDDYLFGITFSRPEFFKGLIELLLDVQVDIPEDYIINEKSEKNESKGYKSIRYDIYVKDLERYIDLEMQNAATKKQDLPKRASVYTANLVNTSVVAGADYSTKLDTYVIFLCNFDPFDKGGYHYIAQYKCEDNNCNFIKSYNTGDYHHYFNLAADPATLPNKEIVELFKYFRDTTNYEVNTDTPILVIELMPHITYLKANKKERDAFIMYEREQAENRQEWKEEGEKIGEQKTTIKNIKNLMETLNCSFDKAAEALKLTTDELLYYKNLYLSNKF